MAAKDRVPEPSAKRVEDRAHALVSSRRVEGTPVFNRAGEKLGTIRSVMLNKSSGRVAYAVMSFGGFLGIGEFVHPIPWAMLTYDEKHDGYVVDLTPERLQSAPTFRLDEADRPRERSEDELVYGYYGQLPWWLSVP